MSTDQSQQEKESKSKFEITVTVEDVSDNMYLLLEIFGGTVKADGKEFEVEVCAAGTGLHLHIGDKYFMVDGIEIIKKIMMEEGVIINA